MGTCFAGEMVAAADAGPGEWAVDDDDGRGRHFTAAFGFAGANGCNQANKTMTPTAIVTYPTPSMIQNMGFADQPLIPIRRAMARRFPSGLPFP